jgi:hypothetical protein
VQLTQENIKKLKLALPKMPDKEKRRVAELLKTYQNQLTQAKGKDSFLDFINHVYPGYKVGPHHRKLARIFEEIANGVKKRVIVNIAPRHGKSEMISYLAPAWFLGKYPHKKVIMASHTADLAVNFGRREILWDRRATVTSFLMSSFKQTVKVLLVGVQILTVSILLLALVVPWLVGVLIYSLLMILILNRKPSKEELTYLNPLGNGFSRDPFKD